MSLEKFKTQLRAKARTLGVNLSQKRIDAVAARLDKKYPDLTEDADHDARIDELHELQPLDEIARTDDRLRTLETKKPAPARGGTTTTTDDEEDPGEGSGRQPSKGSGGSPTEMPEWFKPFAGTIQALATERTQSTMKQKISDKLKDKGIPENFYKRWSLPEKDEDLESFCQNVETDWKDLRQEDKNTGLAGSSGAPAGGSGGTKTGEVDKDVVAFAQKQTERLNRGKQAAEVK